MKVQQKEYKEGLIKLVFAKSQMGQDNQEWPSEIFGRKPLNNLKGYGLLRQTL